MIYPRSKEYLIDVLKTRAENAVEMRVTGTDFTKDIYAFLRRTENNLNGLCDETTTNNHEAFALLLGYACLSFGRLEAIKRIKDGFT